MRQGRWTVLRLLLIAMPVVSLVAPAIFAQTPPAATQQVQQTRTVTTDTQGNTVVTTETLVNGQVEKRQITVTNPQGQLVRKVEEKFRKGRLRERETVTVNGAAITTAKSKFEHGIIEVAREVTVTQPGLVIEQIFRLNAIGKLVLVKEVREIRHAVGQDAKHKVNHKDKKDKDEATEEDKDNHDTRPDGKHGGEKRH